MSALATLHECVVPATPQQSGCLLAQQIDVAIYHKVTDYLACDLSCVVPHDVEEKASVDLCGQLARHGIEHVVASVNEPVVAVSVAACKHVVAGIAVVNERFASSAKASVVVELPAGHVEVNVSGERA